MDSNVNTTAGEKPVTSANRATIRTAAKASTVAMAAHCWSTPALASHAHERAKQLRDRIAALYDLTDLETGRSRFL